MPLVPDAKSPFSSKILLSAFLMVLVNGADQWIPAVQAVLPPQALGFFNMAMPIAIAAFRQWFSGAQLQVGADFRLGK